jgi:hypothetical protein
MPLVLCPVNSIGYPKCDIRLPDRCPGGGRFPPDAHHRISTLQSQQRVPLLSVCDLIFPFGFRSGHAFALPFQHEFTLKSRHGSDDCEHQAACRGARIRSQVQDAQVGPLGFHPFGDFEQMLRGPGQTIEPSDNQYVTLPDEIERRFELLVLADRRYLFTEDLFASRSLEVAELGIEARLLLQSAGSPVTDLQSDLLISLKPRR